MFNISEILLELNLILAQTEKEKKLTAVGLMLFAGFIFLLFLDASIKGKLVPKNVTFKTFLMFIFVIVILILILLTIYYF